MSRRRPEFVVASAWRLISSKFSTSQALKSRASRALSKAKTGARCMASSITVVLTPPARRASFIPRL